MGWSYDKKDASSALPEGEYEATILETSIGTSQNSGKPMLTIVFTVYGDNRTVTLRDWIVNPDGLWKLKKIADALGMREEFDKGQWVPPTGKNLLVKLKVTESDAYGEQNNIVGYDKDASVSSGGARPKAATGVQHTPISEDDIPF